MCWARYDDCPVLFLRQVSRYSSQTTATILLRGEIRILEQQLVELPQYRSGTLENIWTVLESNMTQVLLKILSKPAFYRSIIGSLVVISVVWNFWTWTSPFMCIMRWEVKLSHKPLANLPNILLCVWFTSKPLCSLFPQTQLVHLTFTWTFSRQAKAVATARSIQSNHCNQVLQQLTIIISLP